MKWKKLGLVFNPTELEDRPEWMYEFAQSPNSIMFDDFVRVYFCCRPKPDENNQRTTYCAYVDLNKKNLLEVVNISKEPVLTLGGLGTFDEFGTYPFSVIKDGNDILAYYGGWSRCSSVPFNISLGYAISKNNGESFERIGIGPVLSHSFDEPFVVCSPKIRKYNNVWFLLYASGSKWILDNGRPEIVYKNRMASSFDGVNWIKENKNIIPNILEDNECQAGPDVFYYKGKYHMFFTYRYALDFRTNIQKTYRIGYAYSTNMFDWIRDDENVGISLSEEGWDSTMLHYPHVFECDGKVYMLYNGNEFGRHGFGLAELEEKV